MISWLELTVRLRGLNSSNKELPFIPGTGIHKWHCFNSKPIKSPINFQSKTTFQGTIIFNMNLKFYSIPYVKCHWKYIFYNLLDLFFIKFYYSTL